MLSHSQSRDLKCGWVVIAAFVLASCAPGGGAMLPEGQASPSAPASISGSQVLQDAIVSGTEAIVSEINLRRTQSGQPPLIFEAQLAEYAFERCTDMAVQGYLDHAAPGAMAPALETTLRELGYSGMAAELVFASEAALEAVPGHVLQVWFDDASHSSILLGDEFHFAGLGLMGDGQRWVVTMILVEGRP